MPLVGLSYTCSSSARARPVALLSSPDPRTEGAAVTTPTVHTLAKRLAAVEARLAEIETGYGETIYQMRRKVVRTDMRMALVMQHLGIEDVTDDEVDDALDAE